MNLVQVEVRDEEDMDEELVGKRTRTFLQNNVYIT
jgi:hypothetical protein